MQELVLIYDKTLSTTGHTKNKFGLRRHFHEQLKRLQKYLINDGAPPQFNFLPENRKVVGEFTFLPLVTKASRRQIDLEILVLSDCDAACNSSYPTGDIDNYAKVLLDGLRMAQTQNEIRDHTPGESEDLLYVLMEDDQCVRNINITHHKNLYPHLDQTPMRGREVFVVIKVKIFDKYTF